MRISDWSSDVCSSDLQGFLRRIRGKAGDPGGAVDDLRDPGDGHVALGQFDLEARIVAEREAGAAPALRQQQAEQIGRAPCRERVCQYVYVSWAAVYLKKKKNTETSRVARYRER